MQTFKSVLNKTQQYLYYGFRVAAWAQRWHEMTATQLTSLILRKTLKENDIKTKELHV